MKTIITLLLCLITIFASAHTVEKLCWNQGQYSFKATSVPTGIAVVKVYSNSNYTGLIQTINLNVVGSQITYSVNQPVRTTRVYVKVTWSDNVSNFDPSGTNQCSVVPIIFGKINAKNEGQNTIITFQAESDDTNNKLTVNYYMSDGTLKHYPIILWEKLYLKDTWIITINNITNKYTIKKQ